MTVSRHYRVQTDPFNRTREAAWVLTRDDRSDNLGFFWSYQAAVERALMLAQHHVRRGEAALVSVRCSLRDPWTTVWPAAPAPPSPAHPVPRRETTAEPADATGMAGERA